MREKENMAFISAFSLKKLGHVFFFVNFALDTEMLCCKLVNILMRDSRTREAERSKKVI